MPGGVLRMFGAVCLQAYLLALAAAVIDVAFEFLPPHLNLDGGLDGPVGVAATLLVWWLSVLGALYFPPTAKLMRDVLSVQSGSRRMFTAKRA
jgi:hypothetical protein